MSREQHVAQLRGEAKALSSVAAYLTGQINRVRTGERSLSARETAVFQECRRDAQIGVVSVGAPAAFVAAFVTRGLRGTRFSWLRWPVVVVAGVGAASRRANASSERCLVKLLSLPPEDSELAMEGRHILRSESPRSALWQKVLASMEEQGVTPDDGLPGGEAAAAAETASTAAVPRGEGDTVVREEVLGQSKDRNLRADAEARSHEDQPDAFTNVSEDPFAFGGDSMFVDMGGGAGPDGGEGNLREESRGSSDDFGATWDRYGGGSGRRVEERHVTWEEIRRRSKN